MCICTLPYFVFELPHFLQLIRHFWTAQRFILLDLIIKLVVLFQETIYVVNRPRLKAYALNYCPNLNILTLHHDSSHDPPKSNQPKDDEESHLDGEEIDDEFVDEMSYFMRFGDIQDPQSDQRWVTVKDEPPTSNIHTIRIMDEVVAYLSNSMFIYDLFALCPKLIRASQFGMKESAFQSHTFDFVRCLVSNEL